MILKELLEEIGTKDGDRYIPSSVGRGFIGDGRDIEVIAYLGLSEYRVVAILKKPNKEDTRGFTIDGNGTKFGNYNYIDMENEEETIREMEGSKNTIVVNQKEYDKFKKKVMLDILNKGNKGNKNGVKNGN